MKLKRAYARLLRLYPTEQRALFAAEMLSVFEAMSADCRARGRACFVRFALAELLGLVLGAGVEWRAKLTREVCGSNRSSSAAAAYKILQQMRPPWVGREAFFKIIELIEESGMGVSVPQRPPPDELVAAQARVRFMLGRMADAIANHEFEKVRLYSAEERKERESLRRLLEHYQLNEAPGASLCGAIEDTAVRA